MSRWDWLDYGPDESRQVRDFLSHDVEGEGIDPLRIGASVRDRISEALFPGMSTQYTRLRYVVLAPALLSRASQTQTGLNEKLARANPEETGVIGRRNPRRDFVSLYWTALRVWRFLTPTTGDGRDVTVANGRAAFQARQFIDEDGNPLTDGRVEWDHSVVRLAAAFWKAQGTASWPSIHCTKSEVAYILSRWVDLPNKPALAALGSQISQGRPQSAAAYPWEVSFRGYREARTTLNHARDVSLICWASQLAYNLALLDEARQLEAQTVETSWQTRGTDLNATQVRLNRGLQRWQAAFAREQSTLAPWTDPEHWAESKPGGPLGDSSTRRFLAETAGMLLSGKTDLHSPEWTARVKARERGVNPALKLGHQGNLATWTGTPEMAGRWDFRWNGAVRRLVADAENPRG